MCLQAWKGHPYFDIIDNSTDFEEKIVRMIEVRILLEGRTISLPIVKYNHWIAQNYKTCEKKATL